MAFEVKLIIQIFTEYCDLSLPHMDFKVSCLCCWVRYCFDPSINPRKHSIFISQFWDEEWHDISLYI